jgi:hypothetical protein
MAFYAWIAISRKVNTSACCDFSIGFMNIYGFMGAMFAHHMDCITGIAFLKMMLINEKVPVRPLIRHHDSCPLA